MFLKETGHTTERVLQTEHTTGSALRNELGLRHLQGADEIDLFVILWDPLGTPCSVSEWAELIQVSATKSSPAGCVFAANSNQPLAGSARSEDAALFTQRRLCLLCPLISLL